MASQLALTPDELLTTTRSVRKRLDFSCPVERTVIEECLKIAQQAPTGSNLHYSPWQSVALPEQAHPSNIAQGDSTHEQITCHPHQ